MSNYFFEMSGIYERVCRYYAFLYRYDWFCTPYVNDEKVNNEKIISQFSKVLTYLDQSSIKQICGDIALRVIIDGCYYGYLLDMGDYFAFQQLPIAYCRSRFKVGNIPAVEFNMAFFDEKFSNIEYRLKILDMFPDEFKKAYILYKKRKLLDENGVPTGWYLLDTSCVFKFNLNGMDFPIFANALPLILDLDAAQDLDRRKTMQKLLKIIIQKLPLDKNGDLIFDVEEAADIHNNAVQMLQRAVGVDVMTTFADVDVANMSDSNSVTSVDDLEKVERSLYNAFGVSENLFNTDGNIALQKSILNDEATMRSLILQYSDALCRIVKKKFPNKKQYDFRVYMLETTINNYQDLAKLYKEQTQIGYSKMLPQVALGHSQSSIIATAHFENEILDLPAIMIPPLMSSTMSSQDVLGQRALQKQANGGKGENTTGRPEKSDDEKSEKTIANRESMS